MSAIVESCQSSRYAKRICEEDLRRGVMALSADEMQGRLPGTAGDDKAGEYIAGRLANAGATVKRQIFSFQRASRRGTKSSLLIGGQQIDSALYTPLGFSCDTFISAPVVFVGYGITAKLDSLQWDDYAHVDVKNKIVLAFRGTPPIKKSQNLFDRFAEDRDKAMQAQDHGAAGIILVSGFLHDSLDNLEKIGEIQAKVDIAALQLLRPAADQLLNLQHTSVAELEQIMRQTEKPVSLALSSVISASTSIDKIMGTTSNWYALVEGSDTCLRREFIIIGAHYDHLGYGGKGSSSRRPDTVAVHNGADDNASGVALLLELAEKLANRRALLKRSIVFVAFGGEEMGLLGSKYFVNHSPVSLGEVSAMINLDMIGRLDTSKGLQIGGVGTSVEADSLIKLCHCNENLKLVLNKEGSGPSDHSSFYGRNVPVLFFTSGAHADYHTPDDDAKRLNFKGMNEVAEMVECVVGLIDRHHDKLLFREAGPKEVSASGRRFKVTLGFMPDFSDSNLEGVRVDFVTKGKAAERGGMQRGDVIVAIDGLPVKNIQDYMYRLSHLSKNQIISVEIVREGKKEILIIQL